MTPIMTNVSFDLRSPAWAAPTATLYGAALEMAAYADEIGVDRIGLMEHHGSDDGYLPQPFVMAGGVAAVTKRVTIGLGAVILPLHDPVKLAEQVAVTDLMSNGRLQVIFGAGYVPGEFAMFGVSLKDRARLLDEGLDIILRALRGERFEVNGRPVYVRPLPVQPPEDIVFVGGGVAASARRAARFGVGLGPMRADIIPIYEQECATSGASLVGTTAPVIAFPASSFCPTIPTEPGRSSSRTRCMSFRNTPSGQRKRVIAPTRRSRGSTISKHCGAQECSRCGQWTI